MTRKRAREPKHYFSPPKSAHERSSRTAVKPGFCKSPRNHFRFARAAPPFLPTLHELSTRAHEFFCRQLPAIFFPGVSDVNVLNFTHDTGGNDKLVAKFWKELDDFRLRKQNDRRSVDDQRSTRWKILFQILNAHLHRRDAMLVKHIEKFSARQPSISAAWPCESRPSSNQRNTAATSISRPNFAASSPKTSSDSSGTSTVTCLLMAEIYQKSKQPVKGSPRPPVMMMTKRFLVSGLTFIISAADFSRTKQGCFSPKIFFASACQFLLCVRAFPKDKAVRSIHQCKRLAFGKFVSVRAIIGGCN